MTKTLIYDQSFSTTDLGLVSCLITLKFPLYDIDKSSPHKVQFFFKRISELDKAVEGYWNNTLKVSPLEFFNNIKLIKNRIYSE